MSGRHWYPQSNGRTDLGASGDALQKVFTDRLITGTWPVVQAYASAAQALVTGTFTKIQINAQGADPDAVFDETTNFRLTPNIPGYYLVMGQVGYDFSGFAGAGLCLAAIYLNGSRARQRYVPLPSSANTYMANVWHFGLFNGTTDYAELYGYQNTGVNRNTVAGSDNTFFDAFLVRATA